MLGVPAPPGKWGWDPCRRLNAGRRCPRDGHSRQMTGALVVCRAVVAQGPGRPRRARGDYGAGPGFALTAANGARRTETAWPRLLDNNRAGDFMLSVSPDEAERAVKVVGARSDVSAAGAFSWMPSTPREANGPGSEQIGIYAAIGPGFGDTVFRPMIERGRRADSTRADEITINEALADLTGLDVGDETVLVGLGPDADQPATVVGIHRSALDVGPNGGAPGAPVLPRSWRGGGRTSSSSTPPSSCVHRSPSGSRREPRSKTSWRR